MPASDLVGSGLRQYHEDSVAPFLPQGSGSFCASLVPGCHVATQETNCRRTASFLLALAGEKKIFLPRFSLTSFMSWSLWPGVGRGEGRLIGGSATQKACAGISTGALV